MRRIRDGTLPSSASKDSGSLTGDERRTDTPMLPSRRETLATPSRAPRVSRSVNVRDLGSGIIPPLPGSAPVPPSKPTNRTDNEGQVFTKGADTPIAPAQQGRAREATMVTAAESSRTLPKISGPITKDKWEDPTFVDDLREVLHAGVIRASSTTYFSPEDFEDIWQEVAYHVLNIQEAWGKNEGNLTGFLLITARNKAISILRSRTSNTRVPASGFAPYSEEDSEDKHALVNMPAKGDLQETVVTQDTIRRALLSLSTVHREVLLLSYFEDLSEQEIANRIGISPGTVKSRISAAKEMGQMLILFEAEGLTYEEIADRLGATPLQIERRINKSKQRLTANMRRLKSINAGREESTKDRNSFDNHEDEKAPQTMEVIAAEAAKRTKDKALPVAKISVATNNSETETSLKAGDKTAAKKGRPGRVRERDLAVAERKRKIIELKDQGYDPLQISEITGYRLRLVYIALFNNNNKKIA